MKRRIPALLLALALLLPLGRPLVTPSEAAATVLRADAPTLSRTEGLRVVSYELYIDEADGHVQAALLLQNEGERDCTTELTLCLEEAVEPRAWVDAVPVELSETKLTITIPAGDYRTLEYAYDIAFDLRNAAVLRSDLTPLDLGKPIGKAVFSVRLCEEDLPLVKRIEPVNYRLVGFTVTATLIDLKLSELLDAFVMEKNTYRAMSGSREYELQPEQRIILANYRDWFRDGFQGRFTSFYDFQELLGLRSREYREAYQAIHQDESFHAVLRYLYLRHAIQTGTVKELEEQDFFYPDGALLADFAFNHTNPINRGTKYSDRRFTAVACVQYSRNPVLEDKQLWAYDERSMEDENGYYRLSRVLPVTETQFLTTEANYGDYFVNHGHTTVLPPDRTPTVETLLDYLRVINADVYIRQRLFYDPERYLDMLSGVIGVADGAQLSFAEAYTKDYIEWMHSNFMIISEMDDPILRAMQIPALEHFLGKVVPKEDGRLFVLADPHYADCRDAEVGLHTVFDHALNNEEIQYLLEAKEAALQTAAEAVAAETEAHRLLANALPEPEEVKLSAPAAESAEAPAKPTEAQTEPTEEPTEPVTEPSEPTEEPNAPEEEQGNTQPTPGAILGGAAAVLLCAVTPAALLKQRRENDQ